MSDLFEVAKNYFRDRNWPVAQHESMPILRFEYEGENGSWFCYARVRDEANQFIFLSVLEDKVPEDRRLAVAEFQTRANFGLDVGNFDLDFNDGEVRFKTSVDVTHAELTDGLIDPLVQASLVVMDDYLPGLRDVIAGKATPAEAVAKIEEENEGYDLIL
jgi:hypothetical protein